MREIVVGVDESAVSERAMDHALAQAATTRRPLRAVHAWSPSPWVAGIPSVGVDPAWVIADAERESSALARALLDKGLARQGGSAPTPEQQDRLRAEAVLGDPGRVLVEQGRDCGLLVVGGHGHGRFKSAVVGSATMYVLHHAHGPVMVVPESASHGTVSRVVVGVDGSASSQGALAWGLDAARRHGCSLVGVHAWQLTTLPGRARTPYVLSLEEYEAQTVSWIEKQLATALPERHGVEVLARAPHSVPAAGLLAESRDDDLMVLGSRGHGGFAGLLLGSVATQCAQHAKGPVVVVREGENRLET